MTTGAPSARGAAMVLAGGIALGAVASATAWQDAAPGAVLHGVIRDDRGQPVQAARVALWMSGGLDGVRATTTDAQGRYALRSIRPATYTLAVTRPGHADTALGRPFPGLPATPIPLAAGQTREIDVRLPRAAVISGIVRDGTGAPRPRTAVAAARWLMDGQVPVLSNTGGFQASSSRGEFRFSGLPAGRYLVFAMDGDAAGRVLRLADDPDRPVTLLPVFHPGVTDPSLAQPIEVGPGEHVAGIDLRLAPVPASSIEISVLPPASMPVRTRVTLRPAGANSPMRSGFDQRPVELSPGRFAIHGVPAGRHVVTARATLVGARPAGGVRTLWGFAEIAAAGADLAVSLELQPGTTIGGRYVFDSGPGREPPTIRPRLVAVESPFDLQVSRMRTTPGTVAFVDVPPGEYKLAVPDLPAPWTLVSATADGYDLLDGTLPVRFGRDVDSLVVTFADRQTTLSGTVTTGTGSPRPGATVLAFPVDRSRRTAGSRWIGLAQPDIDGHFELSGLPPGDFLVAAAEIDWHPSIEPERLAAIEAVARRVELRLGEPASIDLVGPETASVR